jgi:quercetin dioxygenase-like cupin family protein
MVMLLFNVKDDMNILKISAFSVAAVAGAVLVGELAIAQIAPPVSSQGVTAKLIGALSLQSQITEIGNRQLRLRLVTIAPGGVLALHDHKDRPSVEMLVKGSATEYRNNTPKLYKEGDAMIADVGTEHWWKNDSQEPAVLVAADIFNAPKN